MPTLISWNTQGDGLNKLSNEYSNLLSNNHDNIIMIQEYGNPEKVNELIAKTVEYFGRKAGDYHSFRVDYAKEDGSKNFRCTTALFVENGYTGVEFYTLPTDYPTNHKINGIDIKRPVVYCRCQWGQEEYYFGTVHLTACPSVAKTQLKTIYDEFKKMLHGKKWIIMGDFNCEPKQTDPQIRSEISYTNISTHEHGKILDYAIFSDALTGQIDVNKGGARGDSFVPATSDHWPIHCIF